MRRFPIAGLGALLLLLGADARAQEAPLVSHGVRAVVEVRAVDLDIVATLKGRPVEDLTKDEIAVKVGGRTVPVDYFARIDAGTLHGPDLGNASPDLILETTRTDSGDRFLARQFLLFFDDAHLLPQGRTRVLEGMRDFVTRLTPSDRVSLVSYGTTTRVFVPFTSSKEDLLDGLSRLAQAPPAGLRYDSDYRREVQTIMTTRRGTTRQGLIRAWSQQAWTWEKGMLEEFRRSVAALGARSGKRVLILVSNGIELHPGQTLVQALGPVQVDQFERSVVKEFEAAVAEANRAGVTVDVLDAKGLTVDADASSSAPSPFSSTLVSQNLREALQGLADGTGGTLVTNRNDFGPGIERIYQSSSSYYAVGITLRNLDPKKTEHDVSLTTTRPGVVLRSRRRVAPTTPDQAARDRMEMALLVPDAPGDFPATLTLGSPKKGGGLGHRLVSYDVSVPVSSLTFREREGKKAADIDVSIAAVSDTGERSPITTNRLKAVLEPGRDGATGPDSWHLTGELKAGTGNFRFVATVRDLATDRIAVGSAAVRVE